MSEFFSWAGGSKTDAEDESKSTKSDDVGSDKESISSEAGSTGGQMYEVDLNADSGSTDQTEVLEAVSSTEKPEKTSSVHNLLLSWGLAPSSSPSPGEDAQSEQASDSESDSKQLAGGNNSWGSSVGVHSLLSSWGSPDTSPATSPFSGSRSIKDGRNATGGKAHKSPPSSAAASEVSDDSPPSSNATTPKASPAASPATSWRSLDQIIKWGTSPAETPVVPAEAEGPKEELSVVSDSCKRGTTLMTHCASCWSEFSLLRQQHHCQHCGMGFCSNCIFSTSAKAETGTGLDLGFGHLLLCEGCKEQHLLRLHAKLRLPSGVRLDPALESGFLEMIKSNLKIDYLDAMSHFKDNLCGIVLPKSDVKLKQAEKDAVRESFIVNGKSVEQDFWQTENEIAENIMSISSMTRQQAQACAMRVFCITNRTCSGAESFFVVTQLFQTPNIVIKCRSAPNPTRIDLSKSKNRVIVKTKMSFPYGLYKKDEVDQARKQPRVWLRVDAVVKGEIRFMLWKSTNEIDKSGKIVQKLASRKHQPVTSGVTTISQKHLTITSAEATELPEISNEAAELLF